MGFLTHWHHIEGDFEMTNEQIAEHLRLQGEQIAEMMKQLQAMQAAADAAAEAAKPKRPFVPGPPMQKPDYTANMSMDRETMMEFARAVPTSLVQAIVADHFGKSVLPPMVGAEKTTGTGWVEPTPLSSLPGQKHIDALIDHQDALDRRELEQKLGAKPGSSQT
jgi:hypothetical protein